MAETNSLITDFCAFVRIPLQGSIQMSDECEEEFEELQLCINNALKQYRAGPKHSWWGSWWGLQASRKCELRRLLFDFTTNLLVESHQRFFQRRDLNKCLVERSVMLSSNCYCIDDIHTTFTPVNWFPSRALSPRLNQMNRWTAAYDFEQITNRSQSLVPLIQCCKFSVYVTLAERLARFVMMATL